VVLKKIIYFCSINNHKKNYMLQHLIGENAGKVWRLLNEKGELTFAQIKKELKGKNEELYMALGWLLRENAIYSRDEEEKTFFGCK